MDCDFEECDCDDCCFPSDRGRGTQGLHGPMAIDIPGPQGFVGPDYVAPQGARGYQGMECCDPEALRGPQGIQGPQGKNQVGFQGDVGPQGSTTSSFDGAQGPTGFDGAQGHAELGMQGRQGMDVRGPQGPQGVLGTNDGVAGVIGAQGTRLYGTFVGPTPINIPASTFVTIASFPLPGPGKYLCTICFSAVIDDPGQTVPVQKSFFVFQGVTALPQNSVASFVTGDVNNNKMLMAIDVVTVSSLPVDVKLSQPAAMKMLVFDFVATSVQTQ